MDKYKKFKDLINKLIELYNLLVIRQYRKSNKCICAYCTDLSCEKQKIDKIS